MPTWPTATVTPSWRISKRPRPTRKRLSWIFVPAQQDVHQLIDGNASHTRGAGTPAGTGAPIAGHVRLTKREQEIKELIAAGLGNKEIARRLNIATTTVKSHVHNMLGKLAALAPPDRRRSGNRSRRGTVAAPTALPADVLAGTSRKNRWKTALPGYARARDST